MAVSERRLIAVSEEEAEELRKFGVSQGSLRLDLVRSLADRYSEGITEEDVRHVLGSEFVSDAAWRMGRLKLRAAVSPPSPQPQEVAEMAGNWETNGEPIIYEPDGSKAQPCPATDLAVAEQDSECPLCGGPPEVHRKEADA